MTLPDLTHLQPPGVQAADTWPELRALIDNAVDNQPRTLQKRIGPSELGTACDRCLIHKLAGHEETRAPGTSWLPYVGTCVHAGLEEAVLAANPHPARWLVETTVDVGEIAGEPITGHADLFDLWTGTVDDWKVVGVTTLRKAKPCLRDPAEFARRFPTYHVQRHLYGRGFARRGLTVTTVRIVFLPRNATHLGEAVVISEPYDESVAVAALDRADRFAGWLTAFGVDQVLAAAPPHNGTEHSCSRWPDGPVKTDTQLDGLIPQTPAAHPGAGSTAA